MIRAIPVRQWLVWLGVAGVITLIVLAERGVFTPPNVHVAHAHNPVGNVALVPMSVHQITFIEVSRADQSFMFKRKIPGNSYAYMPEANGLKPRHAHGKHEHGPASHSQQHQPSHHHHQALDQKERAIAIDNRLGALVRARAKRRFAGDWQRKEYGLKGSDLSVAFYRSRRGAPAARLTFGALAPDTLSRYVRLDGTDDVMTVAQYQLDNIEALLGLVVESSHSH